MEKFLIQIAHFFSKTVHSHGLLTFSFLTIGSSQKHVQPDWLSSSWDFLSTVSFWGWASSVFSPPRPEATRWGVSTQLVTGKQMALMHHHWEATTLFPWYLAGVCQWTVPSWEWMWNCLVSRQTLLETFQRSWHRRRGKEPLRPEDNSGGPARPQHHRQNGQKCLISKWDFSFQISPVILH